jgi:hypothetical protein
MQGLDGDFENELVRENVDNYLPPWLGKTCESAVSPPREAQGHGSSLRRIFVSKMIGGPSRRKQDRQRSEHPFANPTGTALRKVSKDGEFAITRQHSMTFPRTSAGQF